MSFSTRVSGTSRSPPSQKCTRCPLPSPTNQHGQAHGSSFLRAGKKKLRKTRLIVDGVQRGRLTSDEQDLLQLELDSTCWKRTCDGAYAVFEAWQTGSWKTTETVVQLSYQLSIPNTYTVHTKYRYTAPHPIDLPIAQFSGR